MKNTFTSFGIIASLAFLILPGCVSYAKYVQVADELAGSQHDLAMAQDDLDQMRAMIEEAGQLTGVDSAEYAALVADLDAAIADRTRLESQIENLRNTSGDLGAFSVTYNQEEGMVGYSAQGDVFFASGSSELSKSGREALDIVVGKLKQYDAMIRVDGHTDSDPIVKTKAKFPLGNIQLGALRAIAVRSYLIKKGLPENKVYIASFGPAKPLVGGTDADSKRRNRRVEIMVPVAALG